MRWWGCRHFRPNDKRVVQEISAGMQQGQLARVKSLHPNGGPLSKELMARSSFRLDRPSFINSGLPYALVLLKISLMLHPSSISCQVLLQ